jgi:hypothetical protein
MKKTQGTQNAPKFVPIITSEGIKANIAQTDIPQNKWILPRKRLLATRSTAADAKRSANHC